MYVDCRRLLGLLLVYSVTPFDQRTLHTFILVMYLSITRVCVSMHVYALNCTNQYVEKMVGPTKTDAMLIAGTCICHSHTSPVAACESSTHENKNVMHDVMVQIYIHEVEHYKDMRCL